jgi:small neutral amino acid transporter SnatA (MarC family)
VKIVAGILGGLVSIIVAVGIVFYLIGGFFVWGELFLKALGVCLPPLLVIGGIIAMAAGVSSIKDKKAAKAEESEEEPKEEEKKAE